MDKTHFSDSYHRPYFMGLGIILVFIYHLYVFTSGYEKIDISILKNLFANGYFGVDLFFFLSTYGLSYSYEKYTIKDFYYRRFKRIFPTYIVFLLVCVLLFKSTNLIEIGKYVACSITGFASLKSATYQVEWYTPSLLLVYLAFPLMYMVSEKISKLNVVCLPLLVMAFHMVTNHFDFGFTWMFACRLPILFLGGIYFHLEKKKDKDTNIMVLMLCAFGMFLSSGNCNRITLAIPAFLILGGAINKLPVHGIISLLGKHSFEIYLAQVVSTKYFMKYFEGNIVIQFIYVVLITIGLTILFSFVSNLVNNSGKLCKQ